jgi:CHASE2 domain-containing protein
MAELAFRANPSWASPGLRRERRSPTLAQKGGGEKWRDCSSLEDVQIGAARLAYPLGRLRRSPGLGPGSAGSAANAQPRHFQRLYLRPVTMHPVVIVDIDEQSLAKYGQWPWPRTLLADLVAKLT